MGETLFVTIDQLLATFGSLFHISDYFCAASEKKSENSREIQHKKKGREESPYEKAQQLCSLLLLLLLLHHRRIHSGQMGAVNGRERAVIGRLNGRTLFEYSLKAHPTLGGVCFVGDRGSCGRSYNASDGDHDNDRQGAT